MRRLTTPALMAALLVLSAAAPATADPPTPINIVEEFSDVDPCTGETHDVTIDATFYAHEHGDRSVARGVRTITTSGGYAGRGTSSFVLNGRVEIFRLTDQLTDDEGNRIRAKSVFVFDIARDTVRVDRFELTCVGS